MLAGQIGRAGLSSNVLCSSDLSVFPVPRSRVVLPTFSYLKNFDNTYDVGSSGGLFAARRQSQFLQNVLKKGVGLDELWAALACTWLVARVATHYGHFLCCDFRGYTLSDC